MKCPLCRSDVAPWWKTVTHPACPAGPAPEPVALKPDTETLVSIYSSATGWVPLDGVTWDGVA